MEIAPSNINNVRLKLKRLAERGILAETEQGLFAVHPATAVAPPAGRNQPAQPNRKANPGITSGAALRGRSVAPMSGHVCRPAGKSRCG